jgi:hypothetical protein
MSDEVNLPTYSLMTGTNAKAIRKISANKIRLERGTAMRLLIRNKLGNW